MHPDFIYVFICLQRDNIGIGGTWSEFVDYVIASIKSEDVKLVFAGTSKEDGDVFSFSYKILLRMLK